MCILIPIMILILIVVVLHILICIFLLTAILFISILMLILILRIWILSRFCFSIFPLSLIRTLPLPSPHYDTRFEPNFLILLFFLILIGIGTAVFLLMLICTLIRILMIILCNLIIIFLQMYSTSRSACWSSFCESELWAKFVSPNVDPSVWAVFYSLIVILLLISISSFWISSFFL